MFHCCCKLLFVPRFIVVAALSVLLKIPSGRHHNKEGIEEGDVSAQISLFSGEILSEQCKLNFCEYVSYMSCKLLGGFVGHSSLFFRKLFRGIAFASLLHRSSNTKI